MYRIMITTAGDRWLRTLAEADLRRVVDAVKKAMNVRNRAIRVCRPDGVDCLLIRIGDEWLHRGELLPATFIGAGARS